MHQPMQGAQPQDKSERERQADVAIEHAILAIHDYGSRPGATRAKVMRSLKDDGFTPEEIAEAARRMGA